MQMIGRFCAWAALGLGLGLGLTATAATGQTAPQNGTQFGDWQLNCQATAVNQTVCAIAQSLSITETGAFLAEVRLQLVASDQGPRVVMVVATPTNMVLPVRPGYRLSASSETLPLDWRTCAPQRCTASRLLEPAEVAALKAGTQMIIGYQPVGKQEATAFPVSLTGVTAGLAALEG